MRFTAKDKNEKTLLQKEFYSIGGGFVVSEPENMNNTDSNETLHPYPFKTADDLLKLCMLHKCSFSHIMLSNEKAWLSEKEIRENLLFIWEVMRQCVQRGLTIEGVLPGGMKVKRRAANIYKQLMDEKK